MVDVTVPDLLLDEKNNEDIDSESETERRSDSSESVEDIEILDNNNMSEKGK